MSDEKPTVAELLAEADEVTAATPINDRRWPPSVLVHHLADALRKATEGAPLPTAGVYFVNVPGVLIVRDGQGDEPWRFAVVALTTEPIAVGDERWPSRYTWGRVIGRVEDVEAAKLLMQSIGGPG